MEKPVYISPISQFNIDKVRLIRHELGLSQRAVSRFLNPDTDTNILGNIESRRNPAGYNDHHLNTLAVAFTEHAKRLLEEMNEEQVANTNIKSEYTIHDFYPDKPLSDVPKVKTKVELPEGISLTGTLNVVLESHHFLDNPRTTREITDYFNLLNGKDWKTNNLTSTLDFAVKKGKLQKIEHPDGSVQYKKF